MQVFLSYSAADRKLADKLREELNRDGLSVWDDPQGGTGTNRRRQLEEAIGAADDFLILVGARSQDDKAQQLTWQLALQEAWRDSHKRLIPILLRDAPLPRFVFGDGAGDDTRVIRILDPRDVRSAARAIMGALERRKNRAGNPLSPRTRDDEPQPPKSPLSYPVEGESGSVEVTSKGSLSYAVDAERRDRLSEIERFAERLKK